MATEVMQVGDDVRDAAALLAAVLQPSLNTADWDLPANPTNWSARATLDHIANALCGYAASLATGLTQRRRHHLRNGDPSASPPDLLDIVVAFAGVLATVAEAVPATRRAFHPAGMADRDGFVAMGCDEILIHGYDIASALAVAYQPTADLAGRVVARLFPWAPGNVEPWAALLWANGRIRLDDRERLGADWAWHCAPLVEWDGERHRRSADNPPSWR